MSLSYFIFSQRSNFSISKLQVDKAITSIYRVWLSVVAVLSLKFAQTLSLSISISEFMKKPAQHYITPVVKAVLPDEYQKWVPVLIGW